MVIEIEDSGAGHGFPNSIDLSKLPVGRGFDVTVKNGTNYITISLGSRGTRHDLDFGYLYLKTKDGSVIDCVRLGYLGYSWGSSTSSSGIPCDYKNYTVVVSGKGLFYLEGVDFSAPQWEFNATWRGKVYFDAKVVVPMPCTTSTFVKDKEKIYQTPNSGSACLDLKAIELGYNLKLTVGKTPTAADNTFKTDINQIPVRECFDMYNGWLAEYEKVREKCLSDSYWYWVTYPALLEKELPACKLLDFAGVGMITYDRVTSPTIAYFEDTYKRTGATLSVDYTSTIDFVYYGIDKQAEISYEKQIEHWRAGYMLGRFEKVDCTPKGYYWVKYKVTSFYEGTEIVVPTECTVEGSTKCIGYDLYSCIDKKWSLKEKNSEACGYKPPAPAISSILILGALAFAALAFIFGGKKK